MTAWVLFLFAWAFGTNALPPDLRGGLPAAPPPDFIASPMTSCPDPNGFDLPPVVLDIPPSGWVPAPMPSRAEALTRKKPTPPGPNP